MIRPSNIMQLIIAGSVGGLCFAACGNADESAPVESVGAKSAVKRPKPSKPRKDAGAATNDASTDSGDGSVPGPPECLPPCIRAVLEGCLPVIDQCTRELVTDEFGNVSSTLCASQREWSSRSENGSRSFSNTITLGGASCLTLDVSWGSLAPLSYVWRDATGSQIAIGQSTVGSTTIVVACTSSLPAPGDPTYVISTECAQPTNRCQSITDGVCP